MSRHRSHESPKRSIVKALSFRTLATLTTFTLVYIFTGKVEVAMAVGGIEVVAKLALYYLHERLWSSVEWGMRGPEDAGDAPAGGDIQAAAVPGERAQEA
jgi:uncharacterized membrane protein